MNDTYFAVLPPDKLVDRLIEKVEHYDRYLDTSNLKDLWQRCSDTYYKGISKSFLEECGEQGEFLSVFVNQYRNLLKHVHTTTTSARPAFEPEATNTEYESRKQVEDAGGLLDYYFKDKKFERYINRATEGAIVHGEHFIVEEWDDSLGTILDVEEVPMPGDWQQAREAMTNGMEMPTIQRPIYEGDVRIELFGPHNVIRDVSKESFEDQQWLIFRKPRNRWDLVAQFPEKRDKLTSVPSKTDAERYEDRLSPLRLRSFKDNESDDIHLYVFYHNATPSLPFGRMTEFLEDGTVLRDRDLEQAKLKKMPAYRVAAGDIEGAPFGYTSSFDLLALADLFNLLVSTVATNQSNFGVQSIQCPVGSTVKATKVTKGLTLFEYASAQGKIEPLQLTSTPVEIFNFMKDVIQMMETLSGVNSVARGNTPPNLKSGAALAMVQSMHIQFTQDLQLSYGEFVREIGTGLIELFQSHASSPRLAAISGRGGRTHLKKLDSSGIDKINRVTVNMGNQLTRTPAGRYNIAELLVQSGLPVTPEQLLTVLTTGKLESLLQGPQATLDLIQAENEEILTGQNPPVLITDNHVLHIMEHAAVGSDTEVRKLPEIVTALTQHMLEHIRLLNEMPPQLAAFLKQPAAPAPVGPGGPPPEGGQPPQAPAAGGAPLEQGPAAPGSEMGVQMPKNPMTGETWTPESGGL